MYVKNSITKGVNIVKNRHDTLIWLQLDSRFFATQDDIYLCGVYMWGEDSPANHQITDNLFDVLQYDINIYSQLGPVFVAGDWNVRVGVKPDHVVFDANIFDIDDVDYIPDAPLARASKDKTHNGQGTKHT